ncbi:MAG: hypothetical protein ACE15F_15590 [bacterium]
MPIDCDSRLKNRIWRILVLLFVLIQPWRAAAGAEEIAIRDLGVPVRSVNWVSLHAGLNQAASPSLYAVMGQNGDNCFVLQIDPVTGQFHQFVSPVAESNFPTAVLMSRSGKLYIGAAYAGHLLCFDPARNELADLGAIHPGAATFPCRLDEDAQGRIWIGSYGTADLTCYDPASQQFKTHGRMDEVDMYNYPLVNHDGRIANLIRMTRPHVVVFDPQTGEKKTVGPTIPKGEGTLDMHKGNDGKVYIVSSQGNFLIDGFNAAPAEEVPPPAPPKGLPDGSTYSFTDGSTQMYRHLRMQYPDGTSNTFELNYAASGSDIFYLHAGPDGCVYGSSILPLHLFRYNPANGELVDLGQCSEATGEAYSMANLDGAMYISSYPGAHVSVYDPTKPYRFGASPDSNPRELGRIDDISYRPRSTLAGPRGRVWLASIPDYGLWGGPLSYYDPRAGEKKAYYRIFGDGSCYTLAHLEAPRLLAIGTSIAGGSGTQPKIEQADLLLWDYTAEKIVWQGRPDRPVNTFNALVVHANGKLYGTITGGAPAELFEFDPAAKSFTARWPLPQGSPLDLGLQNGPDGFIYGFTNTCIYRFDPNNRQNEVILRGEFSIAGPIVGKDIYFAKGFQLQAARIF